MAASWEKDVALRVVYAGTFAYAALFALAAVLHYLAFEELRFDLGNMVQAIWNTLNGHFLETTTLNGFQHSRLGFHVDPLLLLLAPLFWIWSSPLLLLVVQAIAVASGALPVFWLARKHLASSRAAAHFAFAYLLYPATQFNAFTSHEGFHAVSLAIPLILFSVWCLDEDRLVAFSVLAVLAAASKEEIPIAVGCLGIWYAVRRGRRTFGLGVFGIGLAVSLANFLWVIPHFSPTGNEPYASRYRAVGGTPTGIVHKLFTDPLAFVHAIATGQKVSYLALLLVPFLGLCLLEPLLLFGAVPDLAINLLSGRSDQASIALHWTAGMVPFVVAASIFAAARLKTIGVRLSLWVLVAVAMTAILSPLYVLGRDTRALGSPVLAAKKHAVSLIPARVPVSASNQLGSHLSQRHYISVFPFAVRARWIIVDINDPNYRDRASLRRAVQKYRSSRAWRVVFSSRGILVLHKRGTTSA